MLSEPATTILKAIESPERWSRIRDGYSWRQLMFAAHEGLEDSMLNVVQASKIFSLLNKKSKYKGKVVEAIQNHRCNRTTIETVDLKSCVKEKSSVSHVIIICGGLTRKIVLAHQLLVRLGVNAEIVVCLNFHLNKPYLCNSGVWYRKRGFFDSSSPKAFSHTSGTEADIMQKYGDFKSECIFIAMGTGVFSYKFVQYFSDRLINVHNGLLPHIRGLDSPGWSCLYGIPFGISLHYIDEQIDHGPIITTRIVSSGSKDEFEFVTLQAIKDVIEYACVGITGRAEIIRPECPPLPPLGNLAHECLDQLCSCLV